MQVIKRVWHLWIDVFSFAWLDRLQRNRPQLARVIGNTLASLALILGAWMFLDRRIHLYSKYSDLEVDFSGRLFMGTMAGIGAVALMVYTFATLKQSPVARPPVPSPRRRETKKFRPLKGSKR